MRKRALIAVVILAWVAGAGAQIVIEDTVLTEEVDVFSASVAPAKSSLIALSSSLVLPGAGHYYIDRPNRAFSYVLADVLSIGGAVLATRYADRFENSARCHASLYAGARGGEGADRKYWKDVGDFLESDGLGQSRSRGYNHAQELNRTPEEKYEDPDLQWRWIDDTYQDEYNAIMRTSIRFRIISSFCIGAILVNRIVAFVDARSILRHGSSRRSNAPIDLRPSLVLSPALSRLSLAASF